MPPPGRAVPSPPRSGLTTFHSVYLFFNDLSPLSKSESDLAPLLFPSSIYFVSESYGAASSLDASVPTVDESFGEVLGTYLEDSVFSSSLCP